MADRTCRTIPLKHVNLLDEVLFPAESKNSLRLAYFTQPQVLSLIFPAHPSTEKFKISCRAANCTIFRDGDMLRITMPLSETHYSRARPEPTAEYCNAPSLRKWVLSSVVGEELVIECVALGNSADEKGSSDRLAHQFAEHVLVASSREPPRTVPPRGKAKGKQVGRRDGGSGSAGTQRYLKTWREV
ncbi:hypothetical protein BDD12DRAFT_897420 [Trichophaea hybrida]|nr:hypothetical protein BDD12DRAFT_897420 [Trichophaea hybrida]